MKQIKTIVRRLDSPEAFDLLVNNAISEGWTLVGRKVLQPPAHPNTGNTYMHNMLYAELEKFTTPDEAEDNPFTNLIENLAHLAGALADRKKANVPNPSDNHREPNE